MYTQTPQQYPMPNVGQANQNAVQFKTILDEIATGLDEGYAWHMRSASECRRCNVRGWGQLHDRQTRCDSGKRIKLTKLFGDIPSLKHLPAVNMQTLTAAHSYAFPEFNDHDGFVDVFRRHHEIWIDREMRFLSHVHTASKIANEFDTSLYSEILCLEKAVRNELFRVYQIIGSLDLTGWNGHDISVKSKWLHDQCEKDEDGNLDFNIG